MNKLTAEKCRHHIDRLSDGGEQRCLSIYEEDYLQALEIALPVLEQQGGWISCSERMPVQCQSNRYVPLTLLLNERTVAQGGFDDGQFWIDGVVVHNVTRWQPMPLPPSTTPQINNDGWVEWGGGECAPVTGIVEVRWSTGSTDIGHAGVWRWEHSKFMINIIAYRVIENDGREG